MMKVPENDQSWHVTPKEAVEVQRRLRADVRNDVPLPLERVRLVAGVDVSCTRFDRVLTAGIVLWDRIENRVVETVSVQRDGTFPYVPGLLSFREIPVLLEAIALLKTPPDAWLVDGQGIAHPRRLGIATHLGLVLGQPTVGCAKSILCGTHGPLGDVAGNETPLEHQGERIGTLLRSKAKSNPLIVSPGHLCDHDSALALVKASLRGYRLPEPTRLAHLYVNAVRTGKLAGTLFDA
jgi:deoxyribonuclease V